MAMEGRRERQVATGRCDVPAWSSRVHPRGVLRTTRPTFPFGPVGVADGAAVPSLRGSVATRPVFPYAYVESGSRRAMVAPSVKHFADDWSLSILWVLLTLLVGALWQEGWLPW